METRTKEYAADWVGSPVTEDDLARINRLALETLGAEDVYVRRMRLCNDRYDRAGERFPRGYLERFRETLPGKALLWSHDKRALPIGRFFQAELEQENGVTHLVTRFYMRRSPENEALRRDIDAGILAHVSVGFRWADLVCDLCGKSYYSWECEHVIGRRYDGRDCTATYGGDLAKVEAVEGSLVYLGCQYGSEMMRSNEVPSAQCPVPGSDGSGRAPGTGHWAPFPGGREWEKAYFRRELAGPRPPRPGELGDERGSTLNDQATLVQAGLGSSGDTAVAREPTEEEERRAPDGLPDGTRSAANPQSAIRNPQLEALEAALAEVEPLVADGRLYRADLQGEIQRLGRILGAEKEVAMVLRACAEADCVTLKALRDEYASRAEKLFPPRGVAQPAQAREEAPPANGRAPQLHRIV